MPNTNQIRLVANSIKPYESDGKYLCNRSKCPSYKYLDGLYNCKYTREVTPTYCQPWNDAYIELLSNRILAGLNRIDVIRSGNNAVTLIDVEKALRGEGNSVLPTRHRGNNAITFADAQEAMEANELINNTYKTTKEG